MTHFIAVRGKNVTYYGSADGLVGRDIRGIQEQPDGVLWLATDNGISRLDLNCVNYTTLDGLQDNHTFTVLNAPDHRLWVGMANIKTLRGLIPICSFCHKIRDDKGYWEAVETYLQRHSDASLTHGICPDCQKKNFPDI